MNSLVYLMALGLVAVAITALILSYKSQTRLIRTFSATQGIPLDITENNEPEKVPLTIPKKTRISIPVPGADAFRKPK